MANSVLAKMAVQISANTAEFNKALTSTSNNLKSFTSNIQNIAGTVGIAFGTQQILEFGLEVTKLAGQAEAVQAAFDRLPNSIKLMNDLKQATGGTVSELELMKRAVQAANFDISLEALPRLLEFATLRAQQTGQSVDYLVDSIVTGIGRKSKLILDNLGISAAQLGEELKGVSTDAASVGDVAEAVGRIAEKNLVNMAGFSENASTKLQRLGASWENLKVSVGKAANETGVFGSIIDTLSGTLDVFSSENITNFQKFQTYLVAAFAPQHLTDFVDNLKKVNEELTKAAIQQEESVNRLNKYDAQTLINKFNGIEKAIEGFRKKFNESAGSDLSLISESELRQLSNFDAIMKILNERLVSVNTTNVNAIDTIAEYNDEIKKLTESNQNLTLSDAAKIQANGVLIDQYKAQIKVLEDLAKAQEKLKPVKVPEFKSSLSKAKLPGFKDESIDLNQGFMQGLGELKPPDISAFEETANKVKTINQELAESWDSLAASAIVGLAEAFGGGENIGQNLLRSLANFGKRFGTQLVAIGTAKVAEGIMTKNPKAVAEGLKGIAAGAALVGVSSAIAANNSGGGSSAGSGGSGISRSAGSQLATNAAQNEFSVTTAIKGQDLWVVLSNYEKNKGRTSAIGG